MIRSVPVISTVLVCLLSFSMFGCGEAEDLVEIPDDALHTQINRALYLPDDASITATDMLRLTKLDASQSDFANFLGALLGGSSASTSISDLTGLQYAENLVVLDLDNNNIVDISLLAGLTSLSELDLDDNAIVDISPLAGLINLQKLDIRGNPRSVDSQKRIIHIIEANGTEVLY